MAVLALLAVSAPGIPAQGQVPIGVSPGTVAVEDAQPGQTYHDSVSVQNQHTNPITFSIERNGTVGGWLTTDPAGSFTVPAKSAQRVQLTFLVPTGTGPGNRTGELRFTTQPSNGPTGSGVSVAQRLTVLLRVGVGGNAHPHIVWLNATTEDVRVGEPLKAYATASNDGNVRTTAKAHAWVTTLVGSDRLAEADGSAQPEPGASATATFDLGSSLPVGQYLVHIESTDPAGFNATLDVKVLAEGASAADGRLLSILNNPRVPTGDPTTLTGWFQNTGKVPIASARLFAQVLRGDTVVAQLSSDAQGVPARSSANLTVIWTPGSAGVYTIVGHVEYEGYRTPDVEGRIEAIGQGAIPWPIVVGVALAMAALLVYLWVRRRK